MAWTVTKKAQYNAGNYVIQHWDLSADAATYELSTGLKNVVSVLPGIKSATAATYKVKPNILSAGTAAYGNVAITGCTSGDDLYLTVIGN
jgi:hypothetical protein